jgi:hypothetical protein
MDSKLELDALEAIIKGGSALINEALQRRADIKQGRLASEAMGRVNTATKIRLEYRLNAGKLIEIEAKMVDGREQKTVAKPSAEEIARAKELLATAA